MEQGTRKSFERQEGIRIETESTEGHEGYLWSRVHVLRFIRLD